MDSYCSTLLPNQRVFSVNSQKVVLSFSLYFFFLLRNEETPTTYLGTSYYLFSQTKQMFEDFFFTFFYYHEQALPKGTNLFQNFTVLMCGV